MDEYKWRTGRHSIYNNYYHLVFVTKYRRGVLSEEMIGRLRELIEETCKQMDSEMFEMNGEDDHIHIMLSINPKYSVSSFVGKLKGKSSYFLRKEYWEHIKDYLWGNHFWSPSYCVVTCGGAPLDIIKKYIDDQRVPTQTKHAKKSLALTRS